MSKDKIALIEEICDKDEKVAGISNTFFSNAVSNLDIQYIDIFNHPYDNPNPILNAIKKYEEHHSIKQIKERISGENSFRFSHVPWNEILNEIFSMDVKKATPKDTIQPKLIKENWDICGPKLLIDFNFSIDYGQFTNNCKYACISSAFKKGDCLDRSNYRLVSFLSSISKIFERLITIWILNYRYINVVFEKKTWFSKLSALYGRKTKVILGYY